jgi:hypothetical protein
VEARHQIPIRPARLHLPVPARPPPRVEGLRRAPRAPVARRDAHGRRQVTRHPRRARPRHVARALDPLGVPPRTKRRSRRASRTSTRRSPR